MTSSRINSTSGITGVGFLDDAERHAAFPIRGRGPDNPAQWNEIKRLGRPSRPRSSNSSRTLFATMASTARGKPEGLDALNNIDKHRRLHIIRTLPFPVSKAEDFPPECGFRQTIFYRPPVAGTEIERWTFEEPPTEMKVDHDCWAAVVLDEPTLGLRVYLATFVREAFGYVCDVIGRFNTLFGFEPWRTWDTPEKSAYVDREDGSAGQLDSP